MDELIIIKRSELIRAIEKTLARLNHNEIDDWISKNQASKIAKRIKIERAMHDGRVRFYVVNNKKIPRIWINRADVEKILNNGNK